MFSFGRFITGALISAALAIGGVWFVVDVSLRGVESAIEVTNARLGSVETDIRQLQGDLGALRTDLNEFQIEVLREFQTTRDAITKTSAKEADRLLSTLDGVFNLPGFNPQADFPADVAAAARRYGDDGTTVMKLEGLPIFVPTAETATPNWRTLPSADGGDLIVVMSATNGAPATPCAVRTTENGVVTLRPNGDYAVTLKDGIVCRPPADEGRDQK